VRHAERSCPPRARDAARRALVALAAAVALGAPLACDRVRDAPRGDASHAEHEHEHDAHEEGERASQGAHGADAVAPAGGGEGRPGEGAADVIRVDPGMLRDLRVTTAPVESRPAGASVGVLGELHVAESAYAEVGTPIPARVVTVQVLPGDRVAAGDPLVELESVELGRARAAYQSAVARAELARRTLERRRALAAENVVPARRVQEAEAESRAADADRGAAASALHALGVDPARDGAREPGEAARLTLRAPLDGVVLERDAAVGSLAEPARPLLRIGDLSQLWLNAHAFERDAVRIAPGTPASISFTALPGRVFTGTVQAVGSHVEPTSRTIPVRIAVTNEDGLLRPGMSATARVPLAGDESEVLAVPAAALQRLADGWSVFLPRGEGSFEVRQVGRGRDLGGEVEILSGLTAADRVVVDGAFLLRAEAEKGRGGDEHDHAH